MDGPLASVHFITLHGKIVISERKIEKNISLPSFLPSLARDAASLTLRISVERKRQQFRKKKTSGLMKKGLASCIISRAFHFGLLSPETWTELQFLNRG